MPQARAAERSAIGDLDDAWAEIEPPVVRRIMIAATHEFSARGYHGTTTRDIAARAGLSPAGRPDCVRRIQLSSNRAPSMRRERCIGNRPLTCAHSTRP